MSNEVGKYIIVRRAWICNICFKPTYTNKITHKCANAPHYLGNVQIARIPKKKLDAVLKALKS